jgi:hypothetical protein
VFDDVKTGDGVEAVLAGNMPLQLIKSSGIGGRASLSGKLDGAVVEIEADRAMAAGDRALQEFAGAAPDVQQMQTRIRYVRQASVEFPPDRIALISWICCRRPNDRRHSHLEAAATALMKLDVGRQEVP